MTAEPIVVAEAVSVRLGARLVLEDISLALRPGTLTAVLGCNGAGKTTLLRVLTGELAPSAGRVLLQGAPLVRIAPTELARRRAVLSQHHPLAFGLSVAEVVALGRLPHRRGPQAASSRAALRAVCADFALAPLWRRSYATLSGGERQRVQLARAAAQLWRPDGDHAGQALFLDEPAAALDLAQQAVALGFAADMAARGAAVVAVVHDPNHAARADHAVLLRDGRVQAAGAPPVVLSAERLAACLGVRLRTVFGPAGDVSYLL